MNRNSRFVAALVLSIVMMVVAAGAWAAPKHRGTVPEVPPQYPPSGPKCLEEVDMETAVFVRSSPGCIMLVELIEDPAKEYVPAPKDMAFVGDTFKVTTDPVDVIVKVCYAYPPELADKKALIYKLNEEATPNIWGELLVPVVENGTICVESVAGVFSLIGKQ